MDNESNIIPLPASPSVPGVSEGKAIVAPVEQAPPPDASSGLPTKPGDTAASVVRAGGNKGGRPRDDGLVPGSPEAKAKDREKNRLAKQQQRARERQQREQTELPPALPSARTASPAATTNETPDSGMGVGAPVTALEWTAADCVDVAPEILDLLEQADVADQMDGTEILPPPIVDKIAADCAWPEKVRKSLRGSSPAVIAKAFNFLGVPLAAKPYLTSCPLVIVLIIRRIKNKADIRQYIADYVEAQKASEPPKPAPAK